MSHSCPNFSTSPFTVQLDSEPMLTDTSGYDFGYLLKILTCEPLPTNEADFFHLMSIWFPTIYDIKHIVRSVKTLRGGLQEMAESLGVS